MTKPFYTLSEIAARRGCSASTLFRHFRAGTGPKTYKIGKHRLVAHSDLETWLSQQP